MNMLETKPAVFVVKEHYHIMIPVACPCLMWAKLIREDVKPDIMICGHTHKLEIDEVGGKNDFYGQACPVLVGSEPEFYDPAVSDVKSFKGSGISFSDKEIKVEFTTCERKVVGKYIIKVG